MKLFISQNIKYLLDKENWDHATFGAQFDVSRSSVSTYVSNKATPKVETLVKIAEYFNITLDQLITGDLQREQYIEVVGVNEPPVDYITESLRVKLDSRERELQEKDRHIDSLRDHINVLQEIVSNKNNSSKAS